MFYEGEGLTQFIREYGSNNNSTVASNDGNSMKEETK
jgi:hypothetical protein